MPARRAVAVALGSNLGDRRAHLAAAIEQLRVLLEGLRTSTYVETEAAGVPDVQPRYLNAACTGTSEAPARDLLAAFLRIEAEQGRARPSPNAPRTLDLDLILAGDEVIAEPALVVPHPRFRERAFVLGPLCEIAPEFVDPVTGLTVAELRRRLGPDR